MRVCRCLDGRGLASFLPGSSRARKRIRTLEFSAVADAVAATLDGVSSAETSGPSGIWAIAILVPISRNPALLGPVEEKPDVKREKPAR